MFVVAAVLVVAVPVAALVALLVDAFNGDDVDALLRDEAKWGCGCCGGAWTSLAEYYAHRCGRMVAR